MPAAAAPRWTAIVVAGGRATRLGGIDKTALVYQGRSLLAGVLGAVTGAERICVVGSDAPLPAGVLSAVEEPRWGGPAAAIVAGLGALAAGGADTGGAAEGGAERGDADWVVVSAADLVRADEAVTALLTTLEHLPGTVELGAAQSLTIDGVISVDAHGHRQPLLAVYRLVALRAAAAAAGDAENLSVKSLIGALNLVEATLPDGLSADVDTAADAARLGIVLPGASAAPNQSADANE
ncbi:molybdenum cofactor guanylyltransferase [Cryobacterium arcticum]|uniref:Molybdopterin-guanine dinucleotide biosynthesis protein n=1 Tax=Cryobacterium arcticum TaxID=670052 RepID=A0A317ZU78_9MICO|nr:NTP transferase domain-containing protein [Cryobacterium arcticum]PXA70817.1 molybdopterin-guanine dinucleotide biosynthesis protein [Cryobacterium arcticum]